MELYIIRHAQSTNNALIDQRTRVADPPLTELGQHQAQLLARYLATTTDPADLPAITMGQRRNGRRGPGYHIDRLYCSPMWRSLQTIQPIADALGLKPEIWVPIHEVGGIFLEDETGIVGYGGKTRSELLATFPGYAIPGEITEAGWWTGGLEEELARDLRAIRVATQLHGWAASDERIAIVSHGGFINRLLKVLFNLPTGRLVFYEHYNTAVTRIVFNADGHLTANYINRVDHLPPDMLT
jgi:2,3-bisphosphoglycerate-dependent phosphoglycerate mutase